MYRILFNHWFAANYEQLKTQLCCDETFGEVYSPTCEDDLHNAYLCVFDSLKSYHGEAEFMTLFLAAFRRQRKAFKAHEAKEIRPSDLFWAFLHETETDPTETERANILTEQRAKAVKAFAKRTFNEKQYNVFQLYFIHSFTIDQICACVSWSAPTVAKCVKYCKDCLNCEFRNICLESNI